MDASGCEEKGWPTVPFSGYRFWAARVPPGASRRSEEGPERLRRSQERPREPQEKLRNERLRGQKNFPAIQRRNDALPALAELLLSSVLSFRASQGIALSSQTARIDRRAP